MYEVVKHTLLVNCCVYHPVTGVGRRLCATAKRCPETLLRSIAMYILAHGVTVLLSVHIHTLGHGCTVHSRRHSAHLAVRLPLLLPVHELRRVGHDGRVGMAICAQLAHAVVLDW